MDVLATVSEAAAHLHEAQGVFRQVFILMINDGKASVQGGGIEGNPGDNPLVQGIRSQQAGQGGNADVPAHSPHKGLRAHTFPYDIYGQLVIIHQILRGLSAGAPFFTQDKRTGGNILKCHLVFRKERVPGRTDKADTILKKRLADDVGMLGIAFDQGEIQAVVQHGVFDKTGIIYGDLGINARQLPGILLNERGQEKITDRNAGADPQSSGLLPGRNFFFHFIKQRYDMQRVVVELFPPAL